MVDLMDDWDLAECPECGSSGGDMCVACADILPPEALPDHGRFSHEAPAPAARALVSSRA